MPSSRLRGGSLEVNRQIKDNCYIADSTKSDLFLMCLLFRGFTVLILSGGLGVGFELHRQR